MLERYTSHYLSSTLTKAWPQVFKCSHLMRYPYNADGDGFVNSILSTFTSASMSSYTYTVACKGTGSVKLGKLLLPAMKSLSLDFGDLGSVDVHEDEAWLHFWGNAAVCSRCRTRIYEEAVLILVRLHAVCSGGFNAGSTCKPKHRALIWHLLSVHLEFVRMSTDEDVNIQAPLQQGHGLHVSPGNHLMAMAQPDPKVSNLQYLDRAFVGDLAS